MVMSWIDTVCFVTIFAAGWWMNNTLRWINSLDKEYKQELRKRKRIKYDKEAKLRYLSNLAELEHISKKD